MAYKKMSEIISSPMAVSWHADFEAEKINVRFLHEYDLMHSCPITNTYVFDQTFRGVTYTPDLDDDLVDLMMDMQRLDGEALPFGQVVLLSYYSDGGFIIESATDRWKPLRVALAFEDFGYSDVSVIGNFVSVSEKDRFKLKLKFGY